MYSNRPTCNERPLRSENCENSWFIIFMIPHYLTQIFLCYITPSVSISLGGWIWRQLFLGIPTPSGLSEMAYSYCLFSVSWKNRTYPDGTFPFYKELRSLLKHTLYTCNKYFHIHIHAFTSFICIKIISMNWIFCWTLKAISRSNGVPVSPQGAARWFLPHGVFWSARVPAAVREGRSRRARWPHTRMLLPLLLSLRRHSLRRSLFPGKISQLQKPTTHSSKGSF